jgi:hypothetical protein
MVMAAGCLYQNYNDFSTILKTSHDKAKNSGRALPEFFAMSDRKNTRLFFSRLFV